jgi:predicted site-specific integrase-resolvase
MNKREAADYLGVSERTIERYVAAGKLHPRNGNFSVDEIERLRVASEQAPQLVSPAQKMLLSVQEAAAVSGLSVSQINQALEEGKLRLVAGKIRKNDLEKYVNSL